MAFASRIQGVRLWYAIYRGITTGLNQAFIIDNQTKEALVAEDPKSAAILKPVLRGRDIRRYQAQWAGLWLIATFPALHLNIDEYPAVKKHLLSFGKERLEQAGNKLPNGGIGRSKTRYAWFETQNTCAYYADFAKEKLFWMDMSTEGRFAYSDQNIFCNDKGFIMTGSAVKYLCAVLNSTIATWFMESTTLTTGMGVPQWKKFAVERLPVPKVCAERQQPLVEQIDRILSAKSNDPSADTEPEEAEIDRLVFHLYELTSDEIRAIS